MAEAAAAKSPRTRVARPKAAHRPPKTRAPKPGASLVARAARGTLGGRLTFDSVQSGLLALSRVIVPPRSAEDVWRFEKLDTDALGRMSPTRLLELLADLNPDVARAYWDFQRFVNPGWTCTAVGPDGKPHAAGQAALDTYLEVLETLYGAVDVPIARLGAQAFVRGHLLAELVLDADGRVPADLATPDPATLRFKGEPDPVRGLVWQPGQWQNGTFVILDRPTIREIPIDPLPGVPYGRPIAGPAVFTAVFMQGFLHDLRRVVAQQGYTRADVGVDVDAMTEARPQLKKDQEAYEKFVNDTMDDVVGALEKLEPDDFYVHDRNIAVNRALGAVDSSVLGGVGTLMDLLQRMAMRALKTMPLLMGISDGVSEANANRQWEVHAAGIKAIQHLIESLLGNLLTVGLQAQGIQAVAVWRFAELRAAELQRDALTEATLLKNAAIKVALGFETLESMCRTLTGHEPLGEPLDGAVMAAAFGKGGQAQGAADLVPEPGSNRAAEAMDALAGELLPKLVRHVSRYVETVESPALAEDLADSAGRWLDATLGHDPQAVVAYRGQLATALAGRAVVGNGHVPREG